MERACLLNPQNTVRANTRHAFQITKLKYREDRQCHTARAMTQNTQAGSVVVECMLWTTAPFCSDDEASSFCRYLLPLSLSHYTLSYAVYFGRIIQRSFTSLIIYSVSFCHSVGFSRHWVEESFSHADLGKHYFLCLLICLVRTVHMNIVL